MRFLTGQDRTPIFAGQVLLDWTESGLAFLNNLTTGLGTCHRNPHYEVTIIMNDFSCFWFTCTFLRYRKVQAQYNLQLPLQQWSAGHVYFLLLSS